MEARKPEILWFEDIDPDDLVSVGGKNVGLGKLCRFDDINVPPGFAVSADVYRQFIENNKLSDPISENLKRLASGNQGLAETGRAIRALITASHFSENQRQAICEAYLELCRRTGRADLDVAVRSSATAEDLPEASFAGQQESYLNVSGEEMLMEACLNCFASLYTDRAIAYREEQKFSHEQVALSVSVQQMVRSDLASAGVMFTLDTETGFPHVVLINGAWGLGESVVKGSVVPDRYLVYKPLVDNKNLVPIIEKSCGSKKEKMIYRASGEDKTGTETIGTSEAERHALVLSDEEVLQLARWAKQIESHERRPMDIEWAKDGTSGQLFIVQARPETVESRRQVAILETYTLKETSEILLEGSSVGHAIASGPVVCMEDPSQSESFPEGGILVAERTDPDWVPVMRKAAGIVTDTGGATSHAAIVSRELKVPAIVGTGNATQKLKTDQNVTLDCSQGAKATVYEGLLTFQTREISLAEIPDTSTDLMINAAMPDGAMRWWQLPVAGIGLTRIEFIISSDIRIHPMALLHLDKVTDSAIAAEITNAIAGYKTGADYFIDRLALGLGKIAASQYPKPVVVRMSDFKSNEYRSLLGGEDFEISEDNPMLGLRGASRYYHPSYEEGFRLECMAVKRVREKMGFDNVIVMIPFCRKPTEADKVLDTMADVGLVRGESGLQVYVMCEIPSNVVLADQFAERFDGFSIGSNDLTQLVLGIDRDSKELSELFDATDESVKRMIKHLISVAHQRGCRVGICGQAPSDNPEFAAFLVECGIDSISLNPDSLVRTAECIAQFEISGKNM